MAYGRRPRIQAGLSGGIAGHQAAMRSQYSQGIAAGGSNVTIDASGNRVTGTHNVTSASPRRAVGGGLAGSYQAAYDQARRANEARYQQILQGYGARRQEAETLLADLGQRERADLQERHFESSAALAQQGLAWQGSTIEPTMQMGLDREQNAQLQRYDEGQARMRLETLGGIDQQRLAFMERRTDAYPDQGQFIQLAQAEGRYDRDLPGGRSAQVDIDRAERPERRSLQLPQASSRAQGQALAVPTPQGAVFKYGGKTGQAAINAAAAASKRGRTKAIRENAAKLLQQEAEQFGSSLPDSPERGLGEMPLKELDFNTLTKEQQEPLKKLAQSGTTHIGIGEGNMLTLNQMWQYLIVRPRVFYKFVDAYKAADNPTGVEVAGILSGILKDSDILTATF